MISINSSWYDLEKTIHREYWPRCQRCDMPVLGLFLVYDRPTDMFLIVAECHDETEVVALPSAIEQVLTSMVKTDSFEFGPAFVGPDSQPGPDEGLNL